MISMLIASVLLTFAPVFLIQLSRAAVRQEVHGASLSMDIYTDELYMAGLLHNRHRLNLGFYL